MTYIKIQNASVIFTLYNNKARLVTNKLFNTIVGAKTNSLDSSTYIHALENITLEINDGDRVAIIGHNGAGKSTLLKLISGIYEPLLGSIETKGKVSSLTGLTIGMDVDCTGYENIIMRLIFMGLTFKEAKAKIEDIISFSELAEFINLPVRTYSTGMYVRLAYSVATSIIPDILVMDEMIGAGDASFIHKAKQRSLELIEQTKIMVISSHNTELLAELCNRGVWMKQGKILMEGPINDVLEAYNKETSDLIVL